MADVSMKDFLTQYFMQRIFNEMPEEQFARLSDFLKAGDLTDNMKLWKDKKLVINSGTADKPIFGKNREYPGDAGHEIQMSDDEWRKLFKEFRNAFRAMDADRASFGDDQKKAVEFLNDNFGPSKMFSHASPTPEEDREIQNVLKPMLQSNSPIKWAIELTKWGLFDTQENAKKFIDDINADKYKHDPNLQKKLLTVVENIEYYKNQPAYANVADSIPDFPNLSGKSELGGDVIDNAQLSAFKAGQYKVLLNALTNDKIRNTFQNYGNKITKPFDDAKGKLGYDNPESKDYVQPKRDDKLTPFQQISRWLGDTWADRMGKYSKLHGGKIYFSDQANAIMKALDGTDFKPTDGLDKFISKMGDISKNLTSPTAKEHMKWFKATMEKLQSDKQMKKIFAGALKNGEQMKELISEIAIQAVQDGKGEEAKTAMEVLKTIQYGYVTSNTYNAFKSQKFSFLSDGNLSWNKNEGIKFVTTAMDKTFGFALKAVGLGVTMGVNAYRRSGRKFNNNATKRLKEAQDKKYANDKADAAQKFNALQHADSKLKAQYTQDLNDLDRTDGINDDTIDRKERWLTGLQGIAGRRKTDLENAKNAQSTAQESVDAAQQNLTQAQQNYDSVNDVIKSHHDKEAELAKLQKGLRNLQQQIRRIDKKTHDKNDPTKTVSLSARDNARLMALSNKEIALQDQIKQKQAEINSNRQAYNNAQTDIVTLGNTLTTAQNALNNANTDLNTAQSQMQTAEQRYSDSQQQANELEEKINKFKTATENLNALQDRMQKREEEWKNWDNKHQDQFVDLMAHWDFLNSGYKRTGENVFSYLMHNILPFSRKKRQAKYNARKQQALNDFKAGYTR